MENNGSSMFIETEKLSDYAANTARLMKTEGEASGHGRSALRP